jgi:hypothetical protein
VRGYWQPNGACLLAITLLFTGLCTNHDRLLNKPDTSATATVVLRMIF